MNPMLHSQDDSQPDSHRNDLESAVELVAADHDRRLNYGLPSAVVFNVFLALLLASELRGSVDPDVLHGWIVALGVTLVARTALFPFGHRGDRPARLAAWHRLYVVATALVALVWGAAAWMFFVPDQPSLQMLLTAVLIGLCTGALIHNLPVWRMVWFYSACLLVPLAVQFYRAPSDTSTAMIMLLALLLAAIFIFSRQMAILLARQRRLRHEQKLHADQERLQREQFRLLIESTRAVIWEADPKTLSFRYVSPEVARLLGYPAADWLESPTFLIDHIVPEDRETVLEVLRPGRLAEQEQSVDFRMTAADGRVLWIRAVISAVIENDRVVRIGGIMIDITELKVIASDLQYVSGLQQLMVDISRDLIRQGSDEPELLLDSILERTGRRCNADRAYFMRFNEDLTSFYCSHEWVADGIDPTIDQVITRPTSSVPCLMERLVSREHVLIPDVDALPEDWSAERAVFREQGVKSLIALPVFANQVLIGLVGFDAVRADRTFAEEEVSLLQVLADLLGEELERASAILELQQCQARRRDVEYLARMGAWRWYVAEDQLRISEECADVIGVHPGPIRRQRLLGWIAAEDRAEVERAFDAAARSGTAFDAEFRMTRPVDSRQVWIKAHAKNPEPDATADYYLGYLQDVTARKEAEEGLYRQARFDSLTDLPNRALLTERLEQALKRSRKHAARVGVMALDLDHFKKVNETLGHAAGDRLLIDVSKRLAATIRSQDTLARAGGDEFLILLDDLDGPEQPRLVADSIVAAFRKPFQLEQRELVLTVSIGLAVSTEDGTEANELIRNADTAMTQAKRLGRDGHCRFDREMTQAVSRQLTLEEMLRGALDRNEITAHYQPLIRLSDRQIAGFEALMRWQHPTLGQVRPDEFIPVAEQIGLIDKLADYLFRIATEALARWRQVSGLPLTLSVNVSPRQFRNPEFASRMLEMISDAGLPNQAVKIEVTEGVLLSGIQGVRATLAELLDRGVGIVMDDFGTGYSSLSYLRDYPFSSVKVDQRFVRDLGRDARSRQLVISVIRLGHALGMEVVAEGIESEPQAALLVEEGCEFGQGFFFSPPVPAEEIDAMLSE